MIFFFKSSILKVQPKRPRCLKLIRIDAVGEMHRDLAIFRNEYSPAESPECTCSTRL